MNRTIITNPCPKCDRDNMVRNGHDHNGAQKHYGQDCQSYGTLQAQCGYDERMQSQVERAVLESIIFLGG